MPLLPTLCVYEKVAGGGQGLRSCTVRSNRVLPYYTKLAMLSTLYYFVVKGKLFWSKKFSSSGIWTENRFFLMWIKRLDVVYLRCEDLQQITIGFMFHSGKAHLFFELSNEHLSKRIFLPWLEHSKEALVMTRRQKSQEFLWWSNEINVVRKTFRLT